MTKLIFDPQTERVLGVGIVGAGAGEMIAEGVLAIEMAALASDVALTHSSASDAFGNGDGIRRSLLRHEHAYLPAEAWITLPTDRDVMVVGLLRYNDFSLDQSARGSASRNLGRQNVMSSLAKATLVFLFAVAALLTSFAVPTFSQVLPGSSAGTPPAANTPVDPLNRTTPSGSVLGFLQAAQSGDYSIAAQYLQMSPARRQIDGERIATQLKAVMDSPKAFSGKVRRL